MSENDTGSVAPETIEATTPDPEQVKTEAIIETPESLSDDVNKTPADERVFTKKEHEKIVMAERHKAERRADRAAKEAYREALEAVTRTQPVQRQTSNEPTRDQFASDAEWIDAKVDYKLQQRDAARVQEATRQAEKALISKATDIFAKAESLPNFDRETFDELPISQSVTDAILDSSVGAELIAYMSANPEEAYRIAKLSDARQAVELGKLELNLQQSPKTTKASPPISPVSGSRGGAIPDVANMSMSEYKAYRTKQGARWAR